MGVPFPIREVKEAESVASRIQLSFFLAGLATQVPAGEGRELSVVPPGIVDWIPRDLDRDPRGPAGTFGDRRGLWRIRP